ncbi:MAG TPA: ATP-binding protein [Bacteroidales bacterium]|nr:ATP-binding protein [Bacteroidales bacterium]
MVYKIEDQPIIGRQLFDVITSGMYDNPLMIFREYIQNAVDSIDLGVSQGFLSLEESEISIQLQGQYRTITIQDNGLGLSNENAHIVLRSLGCSPKEGTSQRGFRGIGRLGGLAYCDELIFETRSSEVEPVAVITWDKRFFEKIVKETDRYVSLHETVENVSRSSLRPAEISDPARFFRVIMKNVQRFHTDVLMNVKTVCDYLAQVAPVAYDNDKFRFTPLLVEHLSASLEYRCYNITVNGYQVKRPYTDTLKISTNINETINDVELFTFNDFDNNPIAVGWYAKTNFIASLPNNLNSRGIRVRQGNIEIGDEHFLDDHFTERRFASWQIGEIHVLNNRLKPNARRDGFEQTADFERFLEQASLLGRHLSYLCRKSSNHRIAVVRVESVLQKIGQLFANHITYLNEEHYELAKEQALKVLLQIEKVAMNGVPEDMKKRYTDLKETVEGKNHKPVYLESILDGRRLRKFDQKTLLTHVAKIIISSYEKSASAEDILQEIFTPFAKPTWQQ